MGETGEGRVSQWKYLTIMTKKGDRLDNLARLINITSQKTHPLVKTLGKMVTQIIACIVIFLSEWLIKKLGIQYSSRNDNVGEELDQEQEQEQEQDCCPICLGVETANWDTTRCGHSFHHSCLAAWLAGRHTCPVCRGDLDPGHFLVDWVVPQCGKIKQFEYQINYSKE